jgi:hypothetical protein
MMNEVVTEEARGSADIDEARNWQGNPVSCVSCPHAALATAGQCRLRHACVQDRYARRIDRFFAWNPELASGYLGHPYFEVRAIAVKHADLFHVARMLDDADETVRWSAAERLPQRFLKLLLADPHREVRIRVAWRLDLADLVPMMRDADYYVRKVVAARIAPSLLPLMAQDPETEVRRVVARRIEITYLPRMARDPDASVRLDVAERMPAGQLACLQADADCRVRYEVASRIDMARLPAMVDDPDSLVREIARSRLQQPVCPHALGAIPG